MGGFSLFGASFFRPAFACLATLSLSAALEQAVGRVDAVATLANELPQVSVP